MAPDQKMKNLKSVDLPTNRVVIKNIDAMLLFLKTIKNRLFKN